MELLRGFGVINDGSGKGDLSAGLCNRISKVIAAALNRPELLRSS